MDGLMKRRQDQREEVAHMVETGRGSAAPMHPGKRVRAGVLRFVRGCARDIRKRARLGIAGGTLGFGTIFAASVAPVVGAGDAQAFDLGTGQIRTEIDDEMLDVFTYRPSGCVAPSILMVFHGNGRTAESYRDSAKEIADRGCFVIYAPLFDRERFPNWSYHRGGVAQDGALLDEDEWTIEMVEDLIDWARREEGRPEARSFLFGHSAGGQFLSRVAAYALPERVERIVIANPSTYVMPNTEEAAPYGFGLLPEDEANRSLRRYLAAPVTIFLGLEDTGDEDLTMTEAAQRQGVNRLERGRFVFEEARATAEKNGWDFNWKLVHADEVGHTARGMLTAEEIFQALGF